MCDLCSLAPPNVINYLSVLSFTSLLITSLKLNVFRIIFQKSIQIFIHAQPNQCVVISFQSVVLPQNAAIAL